MITLASLAELAATYRTDLQHPVAPVRLGGREVHSDTRAVVMGTLNLSRDSTYRDSVATTVESALRRGRILAAQGADLVDVGAESTNATAGRLSPEEQAARLVPVVRGLAEAAIPVSVEAYHPVVVEAGLEAGAVVVNFTGSEHQDEVFDLAAAHHATVVLCSVPGADVRDVTDVDRDDPVPGYLAHFEERVKIARDRGVDHLVLDPGLGFYYGNLTDPAVRVDYQTRVLLQTFRLRALGLPLCHALPHAFDLFQEQYRMAEPMFAVLAKLAGTGVFRTHEVPQVRAVLDALEHLSVG